MKPYVLVIIEDGSMTESHVIGQEGPRAFTDLVVIDVDKAELEGDAAMCQEKLDDIFGRYLASELAVGAVSRGQAQDTVQWLEDEIAANEDEEEDFDDMEDDDEDEEDIEDAIEMDEEDEDEDDEGDALERDFDAEQEALDEARADAEYHNGLTSEQFAADASAIAKAEFDELGL